MLKIYSNMQKVISAHSLFPILSSLVRFCLREKNDRESKTYLPIGVKSKLNCIHKTIACKSKSNNSFGQKVREEERERSKKVVEERGENKKILGIAER